MVLRSMPAPAWLGPDAPEADVVVSSRVRMARNLRGLRFPHHAPPDELNESLTIIESAIVATDVAGHAYRRMTDAERDYLVGCRLISPDFPYRAPHRAAYLDTRRMLSVMVNEEDHLRLQTLTAGWSLDAADAAARQATQRLSRALPFAYAVPWGFLTASPSNRGSGKRTSAMFHLIGLAHARRLQSVLSALAARGIHVRGLFGEQSRAVGAFFQVSQLGESAVDLAGAGEYLLEAERATRRELPANELARRAREAVRFAVRSTEMGLEDALKVLAWVRWAASASVLPIDFRQVDLWVSTMEVRGSQEERVSMVERATFLRDRLEACLVPK
jgi:protein arginine kinase